MQQSGSAAGLLQARAAASEVQLAGHTAGSGGTRGGYRSSSEVREGLDGINRKLRTAALRSDFHRDNSVLLVDDDADSSDDNGVDTTTGGPRANGPRVRQAQINGADVALPDGDYTRTAPTLGPSMKGLLVCALFMDGDGHPAWYDATIVDYQHRAHNHGRSHIFHLFFDEDDHDDWFSLPDSTVCYSKIKVAPAELKKLQRHIST